MLLVPVWLSELFSFDAYLLKFPKGCSVMQHKDKVDEGFKHYRMNITVYNAGDGKMNIDGPMIIKTKRIEFFRPDLYEHGLKPISDTMYMLSFGARVKA
jgi:hypothetical protein